MLHAIDVANFFIDMANANSEVEDFMTNLRVNKLLYFSQAWSLVRRGKPLFSEELQAWKYGPVVPCVYQTFKPCGKEPISSVSGDYSPEVFSCDELELLIDVIREYGKYSTPALVEMTHAVGTPWTDIYVPDSNNVITQDSLSKYFSNHSALAAFELAAVSEDDYVGYRDSSDGLLVLPKEYDDAE